MSSQTATLQPVLIHLNACSSSVWYRSLLHPFSLKCPFALFINVKGSQWRKCSFLMTCSWVMHHKKWKGAWYSCTVQAHSSSVLTFKVQMQRGCWVAHSVKALKERVELILLTRCSNAWNAWAPQPGIESGQCHVMSFPGQRVKGASVAQESRILGQRLTAHQKPLTGRQGACGLLVELYMKSSYKTHLPLKCLPHFFIYSYKQSETVEVQRLSFHCYG